ncbi:amino acid ABC transporter permease [Selenomonas sp. TAMA-11512]|uniref:amino acid ABC transporter permease n=1 Tax=Selenomonas sp. TAMA-11512 TaxID=3095337 RepID=UPI00308ADBBA|nr:amino acid ABC transporter permease [Selenomonas sp. TAMA-11512]
METRAFDPSVIFTVMPRLLEYMDVTLLVGVGSVFLGSVLGMLLAWAKIGGSPPLRALAHLYTYIMRCTPAIVLLFIVFYGLPQLVEMLFHHDINRMHRAVFAVITFVLLFGAYISEVFRAAYLAVPRGQYEAAASVGISPLSAFFHIMLPQAAVIALPNFGNSTIQLLKEGALAYTIGLVDIIGQANIIIGQNYGAYGIETYMACMLIYWVMILLLEQGFHQLERRQARWS